MHGATCDVWTELQVRFLESRVMVPKALEGYLAGGRGGSTKSVEYNIESFILPRFILVIINFLTTFLFEVDGFSRSDEKSS